jgi:hypothetical protein
MHGKLYIFHLCIVAKNDATEIHARGFSMAIYGRIRMTEGNKRGYVHRPIQ